MPLSTHRADTNKQSIIIGLTLLVCIFGVIMALKLPNALLPPIDKPEIIVFTGWSGKSAEEIEQSLIAPLEQSLARIDQLLELKSRVAGDTANVKLTFKSNSDMSERYIDVLAAINQVQNWPSEVPKPTIRNNASGANATLATAMLHSNTKATPDEIIFAFNNVVKPALMKINGIATVTPFGNSPEQRIDIEFDSKKLAEYALTIDNLFSLLNDLSDRSGDTLTLGQKEYGLSFKGKMSESELANLPIHLQGNYIVRLSEVATLKKRLVTPWGFAAINGKRAFYFRMKPIKGVNALEAVDEIKTVFNELNQTALKQLDMNLVLSRDDSKDIKNAIQQVYIALLLGALLSGIVLFYFVRKLSIVILIYLSVPICLALVMIAMHLAGFSLNVISLAGLALSVGLLLDAAIVVVDNILRLKQQGQTLLNAIDNGCKEVSNAIFSSTLSSVVIFIPILMINSTESQLFEDLAFTISSALMASLIVALIVLPAFARYLLKNHQSLNNSQSGHDGTESKLCFAANGKLKALTFVLSSLVLAVSATFFLMPRVDVLPDPKQRVMISIISLNEPLSSESIEETIANPILKRIEQQKVSTDAPKFDVSGITCGNSACFLYFNPAKGWQYEQFKQWVETRITHNIPGAKVFSRQGSLLSFSLPNSRTSQLELKGESLDVLQQAGRDILSHLQQRFPNATIRAVTPLQNQSASMEFTPKYEQLLYYGLTVKQLNNRLATLTQGIYLGHSFYKGNSYPFYLTANKVDDLSSLLNTELYFHGIGNIPLSELVEVNMALTPSSLLRVNKQTTIALSLLPSTDMSVSEFIDLVEVEVALLLKKEQYKDIHSHYSGSADQLKIFLTSFLNMFIFSLVLMVFLLWLSLASFKLTLAVCISMPISFAGGMIFLQMLNLFVIQALDMITLIGFIILLGLVINNAILLVDKYQSAINQQMPQRKAIELAVQSRKRAIYMSTSTSIFGMLPLMLLPGEGSEIYRGLAAVIIGGMTFSACFGLSFMAALLSLPIFRRESIEKNSELSESLA